MNLGHLSEILIYLLSSHQKQDINILPRPDISLYSSKILQNGLQPEYKLSEENKTVEKLYKVV